MEIKRTVTENCSMAEAKQGIKIGDVICFAMNDGEHVEAMAVKRESDGIVFVMVDCLKDEYPMNLTNTTKGGYDACHLRKALNTEIIDRFPAEVRENMIPIYQEDFLTIPAESDIFGENCWEPMKLRKNRIAFQGSGTDIWECWWLRDVVSSTYFAYVFSSGAATSNGASTAYGIRPAFKISNP